MDNHPNALNTSEQASPRASGPVWLTYVELGDRLRITPDAARQKAIRGRWRKQKGNDGKARVLVEPQVLSDPSIRMRPDNHPHVHPDERMDSIQTAPSLHPGAVQATEPALAAILSRHIERLERELERLQEKLEGAMSERDAERLRSAALSVTVDALKAALDTEKQRVSDLRQERDRWAGVVEASQREVERRFAAVQEQHLSQLQGLHERMEAEVSEAQEALAEWRARPWWRRLAG